MDAKVKHFEKDRAALVQEGAIASTDAPGADRRANKRI